MKKKMLLLFGFFALATILLPEIDRVMALEAVNDGGAVLAAGAAFAPLKWPMGQNNMGGYKQHLLFIPMDCVASAPVVPKPEEATDNEDLITATGSFTFVEGAGVTKPIYLYSTDGEVDYKAEPQGEKDGVSYKQSLAFLFPGNTPGMHAFNALVKNTPGYYIFEDVDGRQFLMGQPGLPASTSPSFIGGKARADRRGTTYTAEADSNYTAVLMGTPVDIRALGGFTAAAAANVEQG